MLKHRILLEFRVVCFIGVLVLITVQVTACSPTAPAEMPYFTVVKEPVNDLLWSPAQGRLVLEGNYICLYSLQISSFKPLIIWNCGYSLKIQGNQILIIDSQGLTVASIGDKIKGNCVLFLREYAETLIGQKLPDDCPEYFLFLHSLVKD